MAMIQQLVFLVLAYYIGYQKGKHGFSFRAYMQKRKGQAAGRRREKQKKKKVVSMKELQRSSKKKK